MVSVHPAEKHKKWPIRGREPGPVQNTTNAGTTKIRECWQINGFKAEGIL